MIELFKNTFRYILLRMLKYIPWIQEMWNMAVAYNPYMLRLILDHLKTQEMYNKVMRMIECACLKMIEFVPDHLKTREMCEKAVEDKPKSLESVPDHLRAQEMCERTIEDEPEALEFVPNYLNTQEMYERAVEKYL